MPMIRPRHPCPSSSVIPPPTRPRSAWVERFFYDGQAGRLVAELHEIEPAFADMVKAGRFKKVSMSFFAPGMPHNPVPGTW